MHLFKCLLLGVTLGATPAPCELSMVYPEFSKQVFTPPKEVADSLFGYSITYQATSKSLIVSSPKADSIGQLFTCNIDLNKCENIRVPKFDRMDVKPHDYWLGATIKAGPSFFMVCAPRVLAKKGPRTGTFGRCFYHLPGAPGVLVLAPPIDKNSIVEDANEHFPGQTNFEHKMDSFGWSIEVTDDDTTLVGGPVMSVGRVIVYSKGIENTPNLIKVRNNDFRKTNGSVVFNFEYVQSETTPPQSSKKRREKNKR